MLEQLKLLIRSCHPILSVETHDEESATQLVRKAAEDMARPLFEWSVTTGLSRTVPDPAETNVRVGRRALP